MAAAKRRHGAVSYGGDRSSITGTFWDGPVAVVVVGKDKRECRAIAGRSLDRWDTEVWSTPQSIYNDLTGVTRERIERKGHHHNAHQDGLWND